MDALGPSSTHPAALLLHAAEQFAQRIPSAHDSVHTIRPELAGAVDILVDAAGREWDGVWQRKLMSVSLHTTGLRGVLIRFVNGIGSCFWTCVFGYV
jgi:hypothetical protein